MISIWKKKKLIPVIGLSTIILAICIFAGVYYLSPSNYFSLDVNPSIELRTNRLNQVVAINPINADAQEIMKGYELTDKNLETVIKNIIDRMILFGYLSPEQDNKILVTTDDNNSINVLSDEVNSIITGYLKERQLVGESIQQTVSTTEDEIQAAYAYNSSVGKMRLIEKLTENDSSLKSEDLAGMRISDLFAMAAQRGITLTDEPSTVHSLSITKAANTETNQAYDALSGATQEEQGTVVLEDNEAADVTNDQGEEAAYEAEDQEESDDAYESDSHEKASYQADDQDEEDANENSSHKKASYKAEDQEESDDAYENDSHDVAKYENSDNEDNDKEDHEKAYKNDDYDNASYEDSDQEDQADYEEGHQEEYQNASDDEDQNNDQNWDGDHSSDSEHENEGNED
jgi:hypothetical protein